MARILFHFVLLLCVGTVPTGCVFDGLVVADGTGFSRGPSSYGSLHGGSRLPSRGDGYFIPPTWRQRGLNFGIDELVSLLVYTGRSLQFAGSTVPLGIADMSRFSGGRSAWHRSHQGGRDVDVLFLMRDVHGAQVQTRTMRKVDATGAEVVRAGTRPRLFFDVDANWRFIAILLSNPIARVQYIFVQDDLRQRLLDHASAIHAPAELIARAAFILHQPSDSAPHNDHFHIRIYCPPEDIAAGCEDSGRLRWHKRDLKYGK